MAAAQGEVEGRITPAASCSSRHSFSSASKPRGVGRTLSFTGAANEVLIWCLIRVKCPKSNLCLANAAWRWQRRCLSFPRVEVQEIPRLVVLYSSLRCSGTSCASCCRTGSGTSAVGWFCSWSPKLLCSFVSELLPTTRMAGPGGCWTSTTFFTGCNSPKG